MTAIRGRTAATPAPPRSHASLRGVQPAVGLLGTTARGEDAAALDRDGRMPVEALVHVEQVEPALDDRRPAAVVDLLRDRAQDACRRRRCLRPRGRGRARTRDRGAPRTRPPRGGGAPARGRAPAPRAHAAGGRGRGGGTGTSRGGGRAGRGTGSPARSPRARPPSPCCSAPRCRAARTCARGRTCAGGSGGHAARGARGTPSAR